MTAYCSSCHDVKIYNHFCANAANSKVNVNMYAEVHKYCALFINCNIPMHDKCDVLGSLLICHMNQCQVVSSVQLIVIQAVYQRLTQSKS